MESTYVAEHVLHLLPNDALHFLANDALYTFCRTRILHVLPNEAFVDRSTRLLMFAERCLPLPMCTNALEHLLPGDAMHFVLYTLYHQDAGRAFPRRQRAYMHLRYLNTNTWPNRNGFRPRELAVAT